jgi:hypothetical protein
MWWVKEGAVHCGCGDGVGRGPEEEDMYRKRMRVGTEGWKNTQRHAWSEGMHVDTQMHIDTQMQTC